MYHTGTSQRPLGALAHAVHAVAAQLRGSLSTRKRPPSATSRPICFAWKPPKYPLAHRPRPGRQGRDRSSTRTARKCHGTYGPKWTYPNKIVPIDEIGTDRHRFDGFTASSANIYNKSWFAQETHGGVDGTSSQRSATRPRRSTASGPRLRISTTARCRRSTTCSTRKPGRRFSPALSAPTWRPMTTSKLGWKVRVLEARPR